jgi:hypothetical protein
MSPPHFDNDAERPTVTRMLSVTETLPCPRCGQTVQSRFYGPCEDCRTALRLAFAATQRDVVVADYEPKMNVTPNAVATKD